MNTLQTATSTLEGLDGGGSSDLVHGSAGVLGGLAVHFHELEQVELGLLQHLHLADEDVL